MHDWLVSWRLSRVLFLLTSSLLLTLLPQDALLDLDSLLIKVLVKIFLEVDWDCSMALRAFHIFWLRISEVSLGRVHGAASPRRCHNLSLLLFGLIL